jgi:hypothetical protein
MLKILAAVGIRKEKGYSSNLAPKIFVNRVSNASDLGLEYCIFWEFKMIFSL